MSLVSVGLGSVALSSLYSGGAWWAQQGGFVLAELLSLCFQAMTLSGSVTFVDRQDMQVDQHVARGTWVTKELGVVMESWH